MATVTDPIILDSTGQDIVTALQALNTPRDTAAYTTSFASSDTDDASATSWTVVPPITGGETHATLFGKLSQIAKNVRYLYNNRVKHTSFASLQAFAQWAIDNYGTHQILYADNSLTHTQMSVGTDGSFLYLSTDYLQGSQMFHDVFKNNGTSTTGYYMINNSAPVAFTTTYDNATFDVWYI